MDPRTSFKNGDLAAALAGMAQEIKKRPADASARVFFAEMLCFAGDFDRADKQLDVAADQDSSRAVEIAQFRRLLRAETARRQTFEEGRLPQLLAPPPPHVEKSLRALAALRAGHDQEASALVAEAEELRPTTPGVCDNAPFDDFRDADDITAGVLETLTADETYYWIPLSEIDGITFQPPRRTRDLLWRRARLSVRNGPDGDVYVPTIYPTAPPNDDNAERLDANAARLGLATHWSTSSGAPARGIGCRIFLVGDCDATIAEIETLRFRKGA